MTKRAAESPVTHRDDPILIALRDATIGDYEVLAELGRGGMAVVYLAHDLALDRKVAIKVMFPALLAGEGAAERFKREARTAASLTHPNIIPIYAVKEHESLLYFVMQFVGGRGMDSIIEERGALPIAMVQSVLNQVGEALEYAHRKGVIHRDIKPGNILVDDEGRAIVTDFGIAKVAAADSITRTGGVVGTPSYMSPEQCAAGEITGASDQYSLGLVAYEMLTGDRPFSGESVMQLMYLRCSVDPPRVSESRRDCPAALEDAVMRMLEREPGSRWPSVGAAITAVGAPRIDERAATRKELAELAKAGRSRRISMGIRTPTSPVPDTRRPLSEPGAVQPMEHASGDRRRRRFPLLWTIPLLAGLGALGWLTLGGLGREPVPGTTSVSDPAGPPQTLGAVVPAVTGIELIPQAIALEVGASTRLVARALGTGDSLVPDVVVEMATSDSSVATVASDGTVTGIAAGTAAIEARSGSVVARAVVTVESAQPDEPRSQATTPRPPVRRIALTPLLDTLAVGLARPLSAVPSRADGTRLVGRSVTWHSSNPEVARVSDDGTVTALSEGSVRISATSEGVSAGATVVVVPAPVASVEIRPGTATISVDGAVNLTAVLRDEAGRALSGRTVTWSSGAPGIASVSPTGQVSGVTAGTARIAASSGNRIGQATVTVTRPPPAAAAEPLPTAEEDRRAIEGVITAFGRAVESRDIARLRQAYPGMSPAQEQAFRGLFRNMQRFTVAMTVDPTADVQGTTARVSGTAHYHYYEPRELEHTFPYRATLERSAGGWRLTSMSFVEQ